MRNDSFFSYVKDNYTSFISLINNKNYIFRVTMYNPDGMAVDIQKGAIKELYIANNLYNPFMNGYIVINNNEDVIERYKNNLSDKEFFSDFQVLKGYRTRGDGRDIMLISIIPIINSSDPFDSANEKFNATFGYRYIYIMENEENLSDEKGKYKRYDLIDYDEEFFKERQSYLSSSNLVDGKHIAQLSNAARSVGTGKMMKTIIADILGKEAIATDGSEDITATPFFEDGASSIFYSSPVCNTILDDLKYLGEHHVSNDPDKTYSFLDKNKWSGEYVLQSVGSIFKKAYINGPTYDQGGEAFIENLTITGGQSTTANVTLNDVRKPLLALELGETSDVRDVNFFNSAGGLWQQKIRSTFVHQYHFNKKQFTINGVDGGIQNVKKDFKKIFTDPMKGRNQAPAPNFIINNTQKLNLNSNNVFTVHPEAASYSHIAYGRNSLLQDALTLNIGVEITVAGSLHRNTNTFLSIDRKGDYVDNDFDNKFLGIYFIVGIEHHFINDTEFVNKIIAVKTYSFTDLKYNEDVP